MGLVVLVVEDSPVVQIVAASLLRELGHEAVAARSGREALAALSARAFDAVLMDVQMPGMGGLEAAREIRRLWPEPRVRIVAMTAEPHEREACLAAGMDAVLPKPFKAGDLRVALTAAATP